MNDSAKFSIKVKLVLLIVSVTTLAVMVAGLIFTIRDQNAARRELRKRLQGTAALIASNATAALTFNDRDTAAELLASVMANRHMHVAAIYDVKGRLFTFRKRASGDHAPRKLTGPSTGPEFENLIEATAPIRIDGRTIGTVMLMADLEALKQRTRELGANLLFATIVAMAVAVLLSITLQGVITTPLKELAEAMKRVRDRRDFSQKLKVDRRDEIGQLIEVFNDLLARLDEHERQAQRHRDNLEEEVAARTVDLERAKREAEAASRIKGEFLANMSHEIRTPLNAIIGMAGLAGKKELSPDLANYIRIINKSARSLLGTINDILDFSKIEAGRMEIESVDFRLSKVIGDVTSMFTEKAAEKGIEILVDISDTVPDVLCGDPMRLQQILVNLVGNAMKFTERGEIEIRAVRTEEDDSHCRLLFSVRDTGIGIPPDKRGSLFSAFTQADGSTSRRFGGTGLGLTISRKLVELMDGNIWVESETGKGSTFHFTAVFSLPDEKEDCTPDTVPDFTGKTVLLVEDNSSSRAVFKKMLESFGFGVVACQSGDEALKAAEDADAGFDIVIVDWMMPGMDGITLTGKLKEKNATAASPFLMITAFGRDVQRREARQAGIEHFLTKPIKRSDLYNAIVEIFSTSRPELFKVEESRPDRSLAGRRVLVVEDNNINRQVAKEILRSYDIICDTADNGAEAVKAVQRQHYDAILMDIQMPEVDGHEATRLIRRIPGMGRLPIIALTAHATVEDRERCLGNGMDDYITKPIDQEELIDCLRGWINGRDTARQTPHAAMPETADNDAGVDAPQLLPGLDVAEGLRRIGGKVEIYRRLLCAFAEEYRDIGPRVSELLEEGNMQKIHLLCHSLKGAAGNISAQTTCELADRICRAATSHDAEEIKRILPELAAAIEEVNAGVESWAAA